MNVETLNYLQRTAKLHCRYSKSLIPLAACSKGPIYGDGRSAAQGVRSTPRRALSQIMPRTRSTLVVKTRICVVTRILNRGFHYWLI